jgi:hypothetical protein
MDMKQVALENLIDALNIWDVALRNRVWDDKAPATKPLCWMPKTP